MCLQAARLFGLLDQRWRERAMQLNKLTGATSLPPTWFTLRKPDGLEGPRSKESRYRYKGGYWEARAKGNWSAMPPEVQQSCVV
ncbi:hypothetical protein CVIRNUC_002437 [Coccomyxa viridis]|uniref:Uncharacterized protein n=1 Tax=Coccomyxa viridis TaxID=1274662 RepID=A0AAV1HYT7_9CHLO|nr:hypothetical protein CVIRNUC_002437 [Coccomyxa viridis]